MYMKSVSYNKNIWIITWIVLFIVAFFVLMWDRFFPALQSSAIALPNEIVVQINTLESQRDILLSEKKTLAQTLTSIKDSIESVEENLLYNSDVLSAIEEEFQSINREIVLNEWKKGTELTTEEYTIALSALLEKKQDILTRKKQTQSLQSDVSKQRNALSERLAQSDLRIRQIDILVRSLDTDIARLISQVD